MVDQSVTVTVNCDRFFSTKKTGKLVRISWLAGLCRWEGFSSSVIVIVTLFGRKYAASELEASHLC